MRMSFKDDRVLFHKKNKQIPFDYHSKPICVTASLHDLDLTRGLVDLGSFSNIMPLQPSRLLDSSI